MRQKRLESGRNMRTVSHLCLCPIELDLNPRQGSYFPAHFRPQPSSQQTGALAARLCGGTWRAAPQTARNQQTRSTHGPSLSPRDEACASPHCFTVVPLTSSLSSFMASHELLKASEEEMKGRILSGLSGAMSPDELFSPGHAHKCLRLTLRGILKKE